MARIRKSATLQTREARGRLAARHAPHWCQIQPGLALGYRKGKRGGRWIARERGEDGRYRYRRLGTADDNADADGAAVLSFAQAQRAAMAGLEAPHQPAGYTVADACDDYLASLAREGRAGRETRRRVDKIKAALGQHDLAKLRAQHIRAWMDATASRPPHGRGGKPREGVDMDDPEVRRRRRDTANRELSILKAALNAAYRDGRVASDAAWRAVQPFKAVGAARVRYLSLDEIRRLLNACPTDLRALVNGALLTGARLGDLRAMQVRDFALDAGAVFIGNRKARHAGKGAHPAYLTDEGLEFFRRHTAGRAPDEFMFTRANGEPWGEKNERRALAAANAAAKIEPPASFHVFRHTYASHAVMGGVPLAVVAQNLGHSDARMVERHYGHLAPSYARDVIRENLPTWGVAIDKAVEPMEGRR